MVNATSTFSGHKVAVVGSTGCGKSALVQKWVSGTYTSDYVQTLGADLYVKNDNVGKHPAIQLWVCSGRERYRTLMTQFLDDARAILVCFDMMDTQSFAETNFWVNEAKRITPDALIILCGTKTDEADAIAIKPQDAQKQAEEWGVDFKSVSSKSGTNVNELFDYLRTKMK